MWSYIGVHLWWAVISLFKLCYRINLLFLLQIHLIYGKLIWNVEIVKMFVPLLHLSILYLYFEIWIELDSKLHQTSFQKMTTLVKFGELFTPQQKDILYTNLK